MKNTLKSSHSQLPLLKSFPINEPRSTHHLTDFQPFSLELRSYADYVRAIAFTVFIFGLLAMTSLVSFEAWQFKAEILQENALLELAQGGLLLLAALVQSWRAFSAHDAGLNRDIRLSLALFAFALFLREVDIDKLGNKATWEMLENALRAGALIMILWLSLHMSRGFKIIMCNLRNILLSPTVMLTLVACLIYACSWPFDREFFTLDKGLSQWFEETFELNACLLFFCASLTGNVKSGAVKVSASSR